MKNEQRVEERGDGGGEDDAWVDERENGANLMVRVGDVEGMGSLVRGRARKRWAVSREGSWWGVTAIGSI